eukprot:c8922_g1_i1.p1 GENE.c8922_g1_i1~~c8922_g1_i1.p1  ORF type:complete len:291 (+),score=62.23 c8922_g1_i1:1-873(+)
MGVLTTMRSTILTLIFLSLCSQVTSILWNNAFEGYCAGEQGNLGLMEGPCDSSNVCGCGMTCGIPSMNIGTCKDASSTGCCFCPEAEYPLGYMPSKGCGWYPEGDCVAEPSCPSGMYTITISNYFYFSDTSEGGYEGGCVDGNTKALCCDDYATYLSLVTAAYSQGNPESGWTEEVCGDIQDFITEQTCQRTGQFGSVCGVAFGVADCLVEEASGASICENLTKDLKYGPLVERRTSGKSNCWKDLLTSTIADQFGLIASVCKKNSAASTTVSMWLVMATLLVSLKFVLS